MLYTITNQEIPNEYSPSPQYIIEYRITGDDGTVFYKTHSEDKAYARYNQMTILADIRDL